jgi:hypothetical protein
MATSPNYNWPEPDNTDLVRNGALAIRTAVNAIDASLVDLKGGTTGQVLAKATGTDMDFTWATPSGGSSNVAGKNVVLNSNFSIWQRGTSIAQTAAALYTADRWQGYQGTATAMTYSRQLTSDTTNLPFIQYCTRIQRNATSSSTSQAQFAQTIETSNSIPFAGKSTTVSFYARKGADYSRTSNILTMGFTTGTGTDQNFYTGFTGASTTYTDFTLTGTWQRFTYTATVPTNASQLAITFFFTPTGVALTNDYYEVTGVQIEAASSASAYSPNAATFQGELAACQRYYYRATSSNAYGVFGSGIGYNSTSCAIFTNLPVSMRVVPTSVDFSTLSLFDIVGSSNTVTTCTLDTNQTTFDTGVANISAASGITNYRTYYIRGNASSSAYIAYNAEL